MSRESRQRARAALPQPKRSLLIWLVPLVIVVAILGGFAWNQTNPARWVPPTRAAFNAAFTPPKTYVDLCALNSNDLAKCDIARVNLLCAEGLAGAESLDAEQCLNWLDNIAKHVGSEIDRHVYKYHDHPEEFNHFEGNYRMMMMVTVLQQDLGIHYNPERISLPGQIFESNEKFFADSKDVFIHGLTRDKGAGTCWSMPVFLAAIGRRLGYPLKLVSAKGHLFVRWEQGDRSFNIEATSMGFVSHPDTCYRTWPAPFTPEEETSEGYLKALTP